MIHALSLESFDVVAAPEPEESALFRDGYNKGLADAESALLADQSKLTADLVQAVADFEFKYVEARAEITTSLAPLFTAVVEKVLPSCISHSFTMQITSVLHEAAKQCATSPLMIAVHPSQKEAVTFALKKSDSVTDVIVDPQLSKNAAWITHGHSETYIDMDAITEKIGAILSTIAQPASRKNHNG